MHIELASTAGSYRRTDMLTMVMPSRISMARLAKKAVVEDMMTAPVKRYNSPPEISIFPAMLNEPGYFRKIFAEHIKKRFDAPYFWHLPKHSGYDITRDGSILLDQIARKNGTGILFYLPWVRNLATPGSSKEYRAMLDKWAEEFPAGENHILTVHDYTIFRRSKENGRLQLNDVGQKLKDMAKEGYTISVELAAEGNFPLLAVPTMGHLEEFFDSCKLNNFGLTIDTYNIWMMLKPYGGTIDRYFPFLKEFISFAKEKKIPINLVHFKPFDLYSDMDAVSPVDSPFSADFLCEFLDEQGLDSVSISFEVDDKRLKQTTEEDITQKLAAQKRTEKMLR